MTGKRKTVFRRAVVILGLLAVFGIYLILYGSGALENSTGELALPTIHTTGTLTVSTTETVTPTPTATATATATATIGPSGEWTVNDTTPNYDPNDPLGVKFGMTGMGIILLFVLINGLFGSLFKSKGGGGS